MGKHGKKTPCWSTSELDLPWGTSKNKEILLGNLVLGKEILLLLEVCTELGKQTVLCNLQVVNAYLRQNNL